jgi:cytochrome c oxidase assembly protein subunit 15
MVESNVSRRQPAAPSVSLHRFSVLLAVCTLFLVVAGASVTSNQAGLSVPDWPLSYGQVMPEMKGGVFYEHGHRMIASGVGFLTIVLAVWLSLRDSRSWIKRLGWAALALVIIQGVLGGLTVLYMLPPAISIAHACLAQIFFSLTVAFAAFTSPRWFEERELVEDSGWPTLRSLALIMPVLVLLQIALGAGYRHRAFGIMPHVVGAIVAGTLIVMFAVFVLVQYPNHKVLKGKAWHLLGITLVQLMLGIIAYVARLSTLDSLLPDARTIVTTVLHVAFGALTMAATVALAIQVMRHVRSKAAQLSGARVPATSR